MVDRRPLRADARRDGSPKRRPPIAATAPDSIAAHAATFFSDALAGRKATTRKGYRDGWEKFRAYLESRLGLDPVVDDLGRLPPNVLAGFYRWLLEHPERPLAPRTASTYTYAISAFLRQLTAEGLLPPSLSYERLRAGLREALVRGDYERRRIDARIPDFATWAASLAVEPDSPRAVDDLRARALILTLYGSGIRRDEATRLRVDDVLRGETPGEVDIRGKGDRERTIFLDAAALAAIRAYLAARGPADTRPYVFVSHGNRRRGDGRLDPRTIWAIVKGLARRAERADPRFLGLPAVLHTHDTRHHFARTVLNRSGSLSVVQDLLGHASPETTKRIYARTNRAVLRAAAEAYAPRAVPVPTAASPGSPSGPGSSTSRGSPAGPVSTAFDVPAPIAGRARRG